MAPLPAERGPSLSTSPCNGTALWFVVRRTARDRRRPLADEHGDRCLDRLPSGVHDRLLLRLAALTRGERGRMRDVPPVSNSSNVGYCQTEDI
jgi:hypothetical protein